MTSKLDALLDIDGVTVAFELTSGGKLKGYGAKNSLSQEEAELIAEFCASVTMSFNVLAHTFTRLSGQRWTPQGGWAYTSEQLSVAIGDQGHLGVFIEPRNHSWTGWSAWFSGCKARHDDADWSFHSKAL